MIGQFALGEFAIGEAEDNVVNNESTPAIGEKALGEGDD